MRAARVMATATKRAMVRKRSRALIRRRRWTVSLLVTCSPSSSDSRPPSAPSWAPPCVVPLASLPPPLLPLPWLPAAASAHGGGGGSRFVSTTTTRFGSTVETSSSASSTDSPATTMMNVVEHPSFEIVRMDYIPEYGSACIISCDRCNKFDIACDKCDRMRQMR